MTSHSQPVGAPELKPCPFCGGTPKERWTGGVYIVECSRCGTSRSCDNGSEGENIHLSARANWNTRADLVHPMPQGIADAIEALKNLHTFNLDIPNVLHEIEWHVNTLCAALESTLHRLALMESQVPQWEKIETAPKDGTEILGIDEFKTYMVTYWVNAEVGWAIYDPVFWMPLPVPPSKDK